MNSLPIPRKRRYLQKRWVLTGIAIATAALMYGNGRMLYLAFNLQPECVPHAKHDGTSVTEASAQAAKSSC